MSGVRAYRRGALPWLQLVFYIAKIWKERSNDLHYHPTTLSPTKSIKQRNYVKLKETRI